jgi:Trk K+ transport system NAD-binding subunit
MSDGEAVVIAVFRGDRTHLPRPDLRLQAGDRLLVIVTSERWENLAGRLEPLGEKA